MKWFHGGGGSAHSGLGGRAHQFFGRRSYRLNLDWNKGVQAILGDLIDQARKRETESGGVCHVGALLQHLVGATFACIPSEVSYHSYSTVGSTPKGCSGDFVLREVVIHATTLPGEALIGRCMTNLADGYRPVVITLGDGVLVAYELAKRRKIEERIDFFDIHQFLAAKVYGMGGFTSEGRRVALSRIVDEYNSIIDEVETDPSMKIEIA